ncbi:MAG: MFS transporter [Gammaproteobacteria bacterium]|nr:MFS transporter [Gammaproteobacteria bacterium]
MLDPAWSEFREHGWLLAVCTLGLACGIAGIPLYSFGYFIVPLMEEYALSRTQVSVWTTVFTIGIIVAAPIVGQLVDRLGARFVASVSFVGLVVAYAIAGLAPWGSYTLYASALMIAVLGCGTLPITFTKVITSVFQKKRGIALGIALCGVLLGVTIASYAVPAALERGGLKSAYFTLAAISAMALPFVVLGLNHQGGVARGVGGYRAQSGLTLEEAFHRPVFWLLALSFFSFCIASTGIVVHLVPAMGERGIPASETSILFAVLSAGSVIGRLGIGYTVDRVFAPRVLFGVFAVTAAACLLFLSSSFALVVLGVAVLGFAIGAEVDLIAFLSAGYFGLQHYGKIYGVLYTVFALGSAVGPPGVAMIRDLTGSYLFPFVLCSISMAVASSIFLLIGRFEFFREQAPAAS